MLVKRLVLLFIAAVFVFLAVPQAPNLLLVWRDCQMAARYFASCPETDADITDCFADRIPASVSQYDPEAACIASYMLKGIAAPRNTNDPAAAAIQYPHNQFFLVQLADFLDCHDTQYDPQIIRFIADRLIALDPKNADYYILKASAVLRTRVGNDVNEAILLLHQAAQCPGFKDPYELYRTRVLAIADKAGLSSFENSFLQNSFPITFTVRNVWEDLFDIAQMKFNDGHTAEGIAISDALNSLLYAFGSHYFGPIPRFLGEGMNLRQTPAFLELRDAVVSPERAHYDHLLLASAAQSYFVPAQQQPEHERSGYYVLAFPLLLHCGRMAIAIAVILVVIFLPRAIVSPQMGAAVGIWNGWLFACACLLYFVISNLTHWLTLNTCCGGHLTYMAVLVSGQEGRYIILDKPLIGIIWLLIVLSPLIILFVINKIHFLKSILYAGRIHLVAKIGISILPILMLFLSFAQIIGELKCRPLGGGGVDDAAVALFIILFFPMMVCVWSGPSVRGKIFSIILCTTFWALAAVLLTIPYWWWLPFTGFLFTALAITLYNSADGGFWRQFLGMFNAPHSAARAAAVLVPAILIYLLLIPVCVPWTMRAMEGEGFSRRPYGHARQIFPPPTPETYQAAIKLFHNEKSRAVRSDVLAVLEPADLNSVLSSLKEDDWDTFFPYMGMGMPGKFKQPSGIQQQEDTHSPAERGLIRLLDLCPRSSVSIITAAMADPNELSVLVKRGLGGDMSAKQPLLDAFAGKYDPNLHNHEPYGPIENNAIVEALIPVSEPNEAAVRLIAIIEKNFAEPPDDLLAMPGPGGDFPPIRSSPDNWRTIRAVRLLPSYQAASVLNAYLDQCKSVPPTSMRECLMQLREVLPLCANASVADTVLGFALTARWENDRGTEPPNIAPCLGVQSINHLKSALTSQYASFRAWSVWQLRRLDYTFTDEEIALLKADTDASVRANLAMAVPEAMLGDFVNDPSPIVQTVILLRTIKNP
jgi:hypothetical protein